MPLNGLRVVSFESRRAAEIAILIEKQGGVPFVAPSVREMPPEDAGAALAFADRLELGEFELLIIMTGVGLRLFLKSVEAKFDSARMAKAMRNMAIVSRGPKPAAVLRELNVPVTVSIPEPNTWREIVTAMGKRDERKVAVLEYGKQNAELIGALHGFGMSVATYAPYRWELPEDVAPLKEAVRRIVAGECDVVLFTSSVQLTHLMEVAGAQADAVKQALRKRICVASVGPTMTESLEEAALAPDIVLQHPKMGTLLAAVGALAGPIVQAKRL